MARKSDDELMELIGARIARWRFLSGLTLEDLARKTGLQASDLAKVEKGQVGLSVQSLWEISAALQVGPENLLTIDTDSVAVLGQIGNGSWKENPIFERGWIYPLPVRKNPRFHAHVAFETSATSNIDAGGSDGWLVCADWNHIVWATAGLGSGDRFVVVRRNPKRRRFQLEVSLREYLPPDGSLLAESAPRDAPLDEDKNLTQRRDEAVAMASIGRRPVISFDAAAMRKLAEASDKPRPKLPAGRLSCVEDLPEDPEDRVVPSDDPSIIWLWLVVSEFRHVC